MHCDRTEPTTLRHAPLARRAAASETAADGFAALLGAAAAPAERERPSARHDERGQAATGTDERGHTTSPTRDDRAPSSAADGQAADVNERAAANERTAPNEPSAATAPRGPAHAPDVTAASAPAAPASGAGTSATGGALPRAASQAATPPGSAPADGHVGTIMPAAAASAATPAGAAAAAVVPASLTHELGLSAPGAHPTATPVASLGAVPPSVPAAAPATAVASAAVDPAPQPEAQAPNAGADAPGAELPTAAPRSDAATPQPATNADARGATAEPATASAPPEQPVGQAAPPTAAPTQPQPAAAQATPFADRAAPLHRAPRAVAQVLELAVERGISHAKLRLRPADLGGVEIRLQTSAAGVTAQVVADSPEAARLLQEAAADLRRALERHDVTLLSLDVSTAGDDRFDGSAGAGNDPAGERARHLATHGLAPGGTGDEPDDLAAPVVATVQLPDGVHVDVLA